MANHAQETRSAHHEASGGRRETTARRTGTLFLGLALLLASQAAWADTFDVVTKVQETSATTVWRIDEPNVKQRATSYQQIKFIPGDRISVDAGGCVQTGGHGRTWKRYVNPSGPNADRLYHGLIHIPGVTPKLTRLQQFGLNADHQISDPLPAGVNPAQLFLQLGYEDDGYGDNGYYAHDDGTEDQCKNVDHAFVVISIGHDGALPPNASQFVGIVPAKFRCQAAWAFRNFNTPTLSWSSFTNAFRLGVLDYLDPATYITYLAARGMASGGNCAGMSLLADVGEDQFVVASLKESFWQNYKGQNTPPPAVVPDINIAHWKQLSAYFLRNWIGTYFNNPATTAAAIERDLTKPDYNYGLLSLAHGTSGHVLVPLRVSRAGNQILIDVYDPNRPCGSIPDPENYPKVVITGGNWSYDMGSDGTWSGSNGMGYIPYVGEDGWSDLGTNLSGLTKVVFGSGTTVEQVTDSAGRHLFVDGRPGEVDTSARGLGRSLFRAPMYEQATRPKRPRAAGPALTLDHAVAETPAVRDQIQKLDATYAADYAGSGSVYVTTDPTLADLTFTLSGRDAARPVRALVSQQGEFFEMRSTGTTPAAARPLLIVHSLRSLAASGVTVQSRDGTPPMKVSFTHGVISQQAKSATIERTDDIAVSSGAKARITNNAMELLTASAPAPTQVSKQVVGENGAVTEAPVRQLMMSPAR